MVRHLNRYYVVQKTFPMKNKEYPGTNIPTMERQWQLYCQRVKLPEEKMHPIQRQETKRAFFGALGQILISLRDDVGQYDEDKGVAIMQQMMDEVEKFWQKQQ